VACRCLQIPSADRAETVGKDLGKRCPWESMLPRGVRGGVIGWSGWDKA